MNDKLVSVISPVKNMVHFLPQMIHSLERQTYSNWEHIIIDGDSKDGTIEYLTNKKSQKTSFISEQDSGLYYAMNKGLLKSTGAYVCILNADDWYEPDFLEKSIHAIESSGADWVFGDTMFHFPDGTTQINPGDPFYEYKSWSTFTRFHHTTVLAKRECFDAVGNFPTVLKNLKSKEVKLNICADYKWFLKLQKAGFRGFYVRDIMGHMRWGGISTTQTARAHIEGKLVALSEFKNHHEIENAWNRNEKYYILKLVIAMSIRYLPKKPKSMLRRMLGQRTSEKIYSWVRHLV